MIRVLLKGIETLFRQDRERRVDHDVDVRIRDGTIVEVGEGLAGEDVIDCSDKVALPGLVNCHSHTPNVLTRGWSDDEPLFPWLESNSRALDRADAADREAAATFSAALMLATGTTTVNDMWNTGVADALAETGIRALLGETFADEEESDVDEVAVRRERTESFVETYRNHPTVHPTVPAHSVYWCSGRALQTAHGLAAEYDLPFHVHLSETRRENDQCRDERGVTPTAWLDDLGVLDERGVFAHAVHLTDDDRARLAGSGAGVAHCPAANLKLGSGVADVPALECPVGLGTDSAASNNTLNLVREGRTAALVHKREDAAAIDAQDVLDMMTCTAARVLGMGDEIGSIEAGKRADLVLLDATDPTLTPAFDDESLLSNLVYSYHGRVETGIVEGSVVVDGGEVLADVDAARKHLGEFCKSVAELRRG